MAFTVTNDFDGSTTLDPAKLDENFEDVENLLNGGLVASNLSGGAAIQNTQLANSEFVFPVVLHVPDAVWVAATADTSDPYSTASVLATAAIPYHGTDTYQVLSYQWTCGNVGDKLGQVKLHWGKEDLGAFTKAAGGTAGLTLATITLAGSTSDAFGAGQASLSSTVETTTTARFFALTMETDSATTMDGTPVSQGLTVTVFCKRANGLGTF